MEDYWLQYTVSFSDLLLKVQEPASEVGIMPPMSCVNVELSRETLDTMLDGLGKIRDQLSSVANKWKDCYLA